MQLWVANCCSFMQNSHLVNLAPEGGSSLPYLAMKDLLVLFAHPLTTLAKLLGPGGTRSVIADSLLMKQQLLVINRSRRRAPNLSAMDRILLGFWSLFLAPRRILRAAVIIRPSTLLRFHEALEKRKYRLLFSSRGMGKPGPKDLVGGEIKGS